MKRPATGHSSWAFALRLLVCALPLLLTFGCYKKMGGYGSSAGAMAPGYGGDGGYYEEEAYGGEGDYGEYEQLAESPPADMAGSRSAPMAKRQISFGDRKSRDKDTAATETTAKDGDGVVDQADEPLDVENPAPGEPPPVSHKRQIIYTATMQVSVYDVGKAIEVVEALPDRFGGWLHQRIDNQIVLRVPAAQLQAVMATVGELGVVDYRLLEALDVTAEYTDLESRIRVLEQMQIHLQALLAKAVSVEQALEVRRALDQVTLELESARTSMRELAKSIAFSTLILRLVERGPTHELPTSNDPFPWVDELGVEATGFQ